MAVVTQTATKRSNLSVVNSPQQGAQIGLNIIEATVELANGDSTTSTYYFARLPSNARLSSLSKAQFDDCQTTGSPVLEIGTFNLADGTADDSNSINTGLAISSASTGVSLITDAANIGKYLWEIGGATTDPGGFIDIKGTLATAAIDLGGTVSLTIAYVVE